MIAGILNYVQSFLVLFLLIKVVLFLIPRSVFAKYISFFSGVILVLGVLHPMLSFFQLEDILWKKFYIEVFEKQALETSMNVESLANSNSELYRDKMKTFVEEEIKKQMQLVGIKMQEIEISLNDEYQVNGIRITVLEKNEEENARLLEYLEKGYHLSAAQYEIVYE